MPVTMSSSLQLDIPQSPETVDPELFKELVRVYNSLHILAQAFDEIQLETSLPLPATDLSSALVLLNAIRTLLITAKIGA